MTNETLVKRIRGGFSVSENMQSLYENNLPLIKKFIKPFTAYECEADLLQESCFGLVAAVQHYEISENVRFMTYARYWILLAVQQYIEKCGSAVRIPNYERQKIIRCKPILTWKMIRQIILCGIRKKCIMGHCGALHRHTGEWHHQRNILTW